jgi:hypothetical protein
MGLDKSARRQELEGVSAGNPSMQAPLSGLGATPHGLQAASAYNGWIKVLHAGWRLSCSVTSILIRHDLLVGRISNEQETAQ